jgi:hypothetical protein
MMHAGVPTTAFVLGLERFLVSSLFMAELGPLYQSIIVPSLVGH